MNLLLRIVYVYLACGLVFGILFITKGVQRMDKAADGAGIGFRLLILPGTILLWPVLLQKWVNARKGGGHD